MRCFRILLIMAFALGLYSIADAGRYWKQHSYGPEIEVWANKGHEATYYYGEDIAVYFRAEEDCYVVVYDIDPSGEVTILFPSNYYSSSYVTGGQVYRIPDYYDDYTLEITGRSGREHIFAVASYDYIDPPDFIRYVGYDYEDPDYYDDSYFIMRMRGDLDDFVGFVNSRLIEGPYSVAYSMFYVDNEYRHHRRYRYWDNEPYYVGSVWIGSNYPGAEVWIDGIYYGIAPILVPSIYFGYHWVWVYYGGYPCYQRYFYITDYQRYYIDVRIDSRYKDYRYRRGSFDGWKFHEKRYRNERDFKVRAEAARSKHVRKRSLPSHVIRHLNKKGVIASDAPILKRIRDDSRDRDGIRLAEKRDRRSDVERLTREKREKVNKYNPVRGTRDSKQGRDKVISRGTYKGTGKVSLKTGKIDDASVKKRSRRDSVSSEKSIEKVKAKPKKDHVIKQSKKEREKSKSSYEKSRKSPNRSTKSRSSELKKPGKSSKKRSSDNRGRRR